MGVLGYQPFHLQKDWLSAKLLKERAMSKEQGKQRPLPESPTFCSTKNLANKQLSKNLTGDLHLSILKRKAFSPAITKTTRPIFDSNRKITVIPLPHRTKKIITLVILSWVNLKSVISSTAYIKNKIYNYKKLTPTSI